MMKLRLLSVAALVWCLTVQGSFEAAAQDTVQDTVNAAASLPAQTSLTARERMLEFITRSSGSAPVVTASPVLAAPAPAALPIISEAEIIPETISEPIADPAPHISPSLASLDAPISTAIPTPAPISSAPSIPSTPTPSAISGPQSFGFFTPAARYLAQRGGPSKPRLTLRYDVSSKNATTAVPGKSQIVDIVIGTDYAAISKTPDEMVIYDFKTQRILNYNPAEQTFTNASLYAAAYRNINTVNKMTEGGTKRSLAMSASDSLDAFFLESSLGYAAGDLGAKLSVQQSGGLINAEFDGESVFSATLNGPKLKDYKQAFSFIALLYHSEPIHPAILAELKEVRAAPNAMTIRSYGPSYPQGKIFTWTLKSQMSETSDFPLPPTAKSVTEVKSVSPLGFVISEAVAGRALGGQADPAHLLTAIKQRQSSGDSLSAWVSAQTLKDRLGGCERLAGLCSAIRSAEAGRSESPDLATLIEAFKDIDQPSSRANGISALIPLISAPDAPSVVLRRAGLALAKLPKSSAQAAGLGGLDAADLLRQAIARNPYDLQAYKGLSQVHAAQNDFIESWDMNDALRAFPNVPSALTAPINRAESKLASRAPGFFPPVSQ